MEYTLILHHYNQVNRVELSVKYWNSISCPPKEIYVMEDGGDDRYIKTADNVKVFRYERTMNVGKLRNDAVDMIDTDWFFCMEPSALPYPYTMQLLCNISQPDKMFCGQIIDVEPVQRISFHNIRTTTNLAFKVDKGYIPLTCLFHKSTFPYYNESYVGWGKDDDDLYYRYRRSDCEFYFHPNIMFIHINHERSMDGYHVPGKGNDSMLVELIKKYDKNNIIKIEKNENGDRIYL